MFKCNNAYRFLGKKKKDNGIHTQYTEITLETLKGKNSFRASFIYLFLSLHYIEWLQYNIRYLTTFETLIPKLQLENRGIKTVCRKAIRKPLKIGKNKILGQIP